jgi:hypothetical protein
VMWCRLVPGYAIMSPAGSLAGAVGVFDQELAAVTVLGRRDERRRGDVGAQLQRRVRIGAHRGLLKPAENGQKPSTKRGADGYGPRWRVGQKV